uniref:Uncharacterized protein n=1 Tax=Arundo donax TaxID=35708 RepID=A0A0A9G8W7_ARUDO
MTESAICISGLRHSGANLRANMNEYVPFDFLSSLIRCTDTSPGWYMCGWPATESVQFTLVKVYLVHPSGSCISSNVGK